MLLHERQRAENFLGDLKACVHSFQAHAGRSWLVVRAGLSPHIWKGCLPVSGRGVCLPIAFQVHAGRSLWLPRGGHAHRYACIASGVCSLRLEEVAPCHQPSWQMQVGAGVWGQACFWVLDLHLRLMEVSALTPAWVLADRPAGMRVGARPRSALQNCQAALDLRLECERGLESAINLCPEASRHAEVGFLIEPAFHDARCCCPVNAGQGDPHSQWESWPACQPELPVSERASCAQRPQNALHAKVHRHDNLHVLISMHFCCADMESPSHEGLLQLVDFWQQRLQAYEVGGVQPQASPVNQAIAGPQGIKPE